MNTQIVCRGLPASWVNAWLASVGATVLSSKLRLHWTRERTPHAVLSAEGSEPVEILAAAWPKLATLDKLPIAEQWGDSPDIARKVPVERFAERARVARSDPFSWTLSSTMTDLYVDKHGEVAHAPLDPAGPGTIKWLHHRLVKVYGSIPPSPSPERLLESLQGTAARVKDNGLGFDLTRLSAAADKTDKWVEPIVEVLAFFGLALFPLRGPGIDETLRRATSFSVTAARRKVAQRGWIRDANGKGALRFRWPTWRTALDRDGIDALLDIWDSRSKAKWPLIGIDSGWITVQYQQKEGSDPTRGFGSERI